MTKKYTLKYKIKNIEPDKSTFRANHSIISIEFDDGSGDQPYTLAFSVENPNKPMSVEELMELIKSKHSVLRPDRFFFPVKSAQKNQEKFETEVDETKVEVPNN